MSTAPLPWLKKVEHAIAPLMEIPLWGALPPFPWDACVAALSETLQLPHLRLQAGDMRFLEAEHLHEGMGEVIAIPIALEPLIPGVFWLMSQEEIGKLTVLLLTAAEKNKGFSSPKFQEG